MSSPQPYPKILLLLSTYFTCLGPAICCLVRSRWLPEKPHCALFFLSRNGRLWQVSEISSRVFGHSPMSFPPFVSFSFRFSALVLSTGYWWDFSIFSQIFLWTVICLRLCRGKVKLSVLLLVLKSKWHVCFPDFCRLLFLADREERYFILARVKKWNEIPQFTIIWRLIIKLALISPRSRLAPQKWIWGKLFSDLFSPLRPKVKVKICALISGPIYWFDEEQQDMGKSQELHDSRGAIRTGSNQQ